MNSKLSLAVLMSVLATGAVAETTQCTVITAVPYVISAPGVYCLNSDFVSALASGNAIDIQASSVTLDMNGHKIGNRGAGTTTTANGIYAQDRQNITIRNGTLRGFYQAITLASTGASAGHLIEDIRADQSLSKGFSVTGSAMIIRRNQIYATGGAADGHAYGIWVSGKNSRILDNDIVGTTASSSGQGHALSIGSAHNLVAVGNRISEVSGKYAFGIIADFAPGSVIRDNILTNADGVADYGAFGIYMGPSSANAIIQGNSVAGFAMSGLSLLMPSQLRSGNIQSGTTDTTPGGTAAVLY